MARFSTAFISIKCLCLAVLILASPINRASELQPRYDQAIKSLYEQLGLVGIVSLLSIDGDIQAQASYGSTSVLFGEPLTADMSFHIGSITKSFTATLMAKLVEQGQLNWQDTLGELFADDNILPAWKAVTVAQLLQHRGGVRANLNVIDMLRYSYYSGDAAATREHKALAYLKEQAPEYPPGSTMLYSNLGYMIASVIIQRTSGLSWEQAMQKHVFNALQLNSAGFGPPKSTKTQAQPLGHNRNMGIAFPDRNKVPSIIAAAGDIHMNIADLWRYGEAHRLGADGKSALLKRQSFQTLHQPSADHYAMGWVLEDTQDRPFYWHNGSDTRWYALLLIVPKIGASYIFVSNDGLLMRKQAALWEIINRFNRQLAEAHNQ
ncbi:serine hydrolase domain-containing protein [Agaribacterium haliotis]|uniref:serine hydrolase domain-containing protein n=1 Tax=Agaribacterium haliotis TaxID=2013869 RepID=UPI000BB56313|nr:serine hydrolase domain-containing protein [Agaribacterium haliotis]